MMKKAILSAILAQALICGASAGSAGTVEMPLAFERANSFAASGKTARLPINFVQTGSEPLVVEAEDADLSFEGNANAGRHADPKNNINGF